MVRGSPLLLAPLAAAVAGRGSLLSAGFIIWAMSGWVRLSRRIRVISRVNAAGSSTSSFASASGLSRTMAMSISPPSLWIIVGRPACISARIATALFSLAAWWKERIRYVGPCGKHTTVVFVPISADTDLDKVHPTWTGTYILDACVFLFPSINFALIDSDCVPVTLFEIQELWLSCAGHDPPAAGSVTFWLKAVSAQTPWVLANLILTQGANIHLG